MSWFHRLRNHARSDDLSREIEREMAFHLDERADELIAHGMSPDAARHEARRRFGNRATQQERARERNLFSWVDTLATDVRYAMRGLRNAPVFTLVTILSLALGIGANTAIFSILNAVMLRELPVRNPDALVAVNRESSTDFTNPLWESLRDRQNLFSTVFAYGDADFNLSDGGEARRISGSWVSGDFFAGLGVNAPIGRPILPADDFRGCPGIAVLDHGYWADAYGSNPNAVGKTIALDGHPFTIVGVADERFFGLNVGEHQQIYVPLCSEALIKGANSQLDERSSWFLHVVGRVKPTLSNEQASARLATLSPSITEAAAPAHWPARMLKRFLSAHFSLEPASKGFSDLRSTYKKALYMLMAIVALVLLVACANIANLLLARATARHREMAVRLALGASRARLVRQVMTESLLLCGAGAVAGILIAMLGSRVLVELLSRRAHTISLDLMLDVRVLGFTIGVATLAALLFGLGPSLRAGAVDPQASLKANGRGVSQRLVAAKTLVTLQLALSLVLISCAGLLLGSWRRLASVDPGFSRENVLLVSTDLTRAQVPQALRYSTFNTLLERVRGLPGVRAAGAAQITPISGSGWNDLIKVDGYTPNSERDALSWENAVTPGYLDAMGVRRLAGRDFDRHDDTNATHVAIVTESMARKYFGTPNVIGRHFRTGLAESGDLIEIVGVVADTKYRSLRDSTTSVIYYPRAQQNAESQHLALAIRTAGSPIAAIESIKQAIADVDKRITIDIVPLDRQLAESLTLPRAIATLSGLFGGLALLLATIGLYGIMAYAVARRRNEIGVRIALGASRQRVIRMVLGDATRMVVIGVILGAAISGAAAKLVATFLYGVQPRDPGTMLAAAALLAAVGALAAMVPAWRASSLDPVAALREE